MKCIVLLALVALSANAVGMKGDKTITKVVKLLQGMLDKSDVEADEEKKIYGKFKCYCDTSNAEKTASIADSTKKITILEAKIEELQGSTGELSSKSAELKASKAENKAARKEATSIREKENKAFKAESADLRQGISQMRDAIKELTKVGADQTQATGADQKQFMAGYKKPSKKKAALLQATMQTALSAAEAFMNQKQYTSMTSFLQAPFTGTYTSQSGQVMGIIKSMRDTFADNLQSAVAKEKASLSEFNDFMDVKNKAYKSMSDLYDEAQESLGENDQELGSKRSQLAEATKAKDEDTEFLDKLMPRCEAKTQDYNDRKLLRANEDAAIAEAISILNSDAAFETFGGVDATTKGKTNFLQVSRHLPSDTDDVRAVMQRLLRRAAVEEGHAPRLTHILTQLQAQNPFDGVLTEIKKMISLIGEEGKADKEKLGWCNKERKENKAARKEKNGEILKLEGEIDKLTKTIDDPVTGLKKQIADTETSLLENTASQKSETKDRLEENMAYQADVKNLVAAEKILGNAIKVLKAYYDQIDKAFLQSNGMDTESQEPKMNDSAESYKGQSSKGGDAIGMLQFIAKETKKEEYDAHSSEEKAQASYEDSMTALKSEESKKEKSLADLQNNVAEKQQDLLEAQEDLKGTTKDRDAVVAYLAKIKPGCDFITSNFKLRNKNRATEKTALEKAVSVLKASPAYKAAAADAVVEGYGKCKAPCVKDNAHVKCKACMADVTIPGYCAGHKGTKGC